MPILIKALVCGTLDIVAIGCLAHFLYNHLAAPERAGKFERDYSKTSPHRYFLVAYHLFVVGGLGFGLYHAFQGYFSWIPGSWISINEDDQETWIASDLAMMFAFFSTLALLSGLQASSRRNNSAY